MDHTHKWGKIITASNRRGKVFTANYTVMSLMGKVCVNRNTYTKSNFELEDILGLYKASRENAGVGKLLRFETDNIQVDGALWERHFNELTNNVTPYVERNKNLPRASMDSTI